MNTPAKGKGKCGCGHCQKSIGSKIAIQCEGCKNLNLVECLSNISENKLKDFTLGNDNFICGKCVLTNVDYETLSLEPAANEPAANVLAIDTTVVPPPPVVNEEFIGEINGLKLEIARKDIAYASLKSKCDLLSSSFDQVTKKVEGIEKSVKDSEDIIKTQACDIQKFKENNENLEKEKSVLEVRIKTLEEEVRKEDIVNENDTENVNRDGNIMKLQEENSNLEKSLEKMKVDYSKLKDALTEERTVLENSMNDLKAENLNLKKT